VSWLEYPLSASTEYLDLQLRAIEHLTDMALDGNLIDILKPRVCLNFGICVEVNTQKLQIMLFSHYCLLVQHTAVRQHFRNSPSLRKIKETGSILEQTCGSGYPISILTSETDTWSYMPSLMERVK